MKFSTQRTVLATLWFAGFAGTLLEWLYLDWISQIGPNISAKLRDAILEQYIPVLVVIAAFYFASGPAGHARSKGQATPYYLALATSALWILVPIGFVFRACHDSDKTQEAVASMSAILPKFCVLVTAAMGFFFGKAPESR
jgi:hypothetical protein